MSDTDDTDVLCLIPPDFFLVNSDTDESIDENWNGNCRIHCDLVENLFGEIGELKNRLRHIESQSISSSVISMAESDMSNRNFQFTEDFKNRVLPNSTNSTPQKPKTRLNVNSLPSTPSTERDNYRSRRLPNFGKNDTKFQFSKQVQQNITGYNENDADVSSFTNSPDKRDKDVLGEIDQFLSHVKTIKRFEASRKLENEFIPHDKEPHSLPISFDNFPLKLSDLKGEGDIKFDKRKGLDIKDVDQLIQSLEEQQQKMENVPISNRIVEGNENQPHTQTRTWKPGETKSSVPDYNFGLRDTLYPEKHLGNIDDFLKQNLETHSSHHDIEIDSDTTESPPTVFENPIENFLLKKPQNELTRGSAGSTAPSDYFSKNLSVFDYVTKNLPQHVEPTIGKSKVIEDVMKKVVQSNVQAAPVKSKRTVTEPPNSTNTGYGIHDIWKKSVSYPHGNDQNVYFAKLEEERMRRQKVIHYEAEMSKALDIAHTNQEKINTLEFEKNSLAVELETVKKDVELLNTKLKNVENERDELRATVLKLETDIQQDQNLISNLQKELTSQKQKYQNDLSAYENELKYLREEKGKLEKELKDSNGTCNVLESKNKSLENIVDVCKKSEKNLQQEINKLIEQQEKAKVELRNFYQQQVEILVKDKLKEFQSQLEQTEKSLHEELQVREQNIAKTAAKQLQKFTDKHQVEIQLLEQKHKEEMNLYEIQIQQLKHVITTQQTKLDHLQMKRNNIAQELKSVMEAQWNEALRIIDNGKTPSSTPTTDNPKDDLRYQEPEQEKQREVRDLPNENVSPNIMGYGPTPRTSRETKEWHDSTSNELQKYIKMLLDKEPGNPTEGNVSNSLLRSVTSRDCDDMSSHPEGASTHVEDQETDRKSYNTVTKEYRASKPPWK